MDIWQEIRKNEESGARRLVSEYGDRVFAAAALLCQNDHDAEELVFRTFDQAIRKIRQYEPTSSFFNWLYTIMLNFRRMDLRRKGVDLVPVGSTSDLPETPDPVVAALIAEAVDDSLWKAIHGMAAPLREVVMLRYFAERPVEEIATALSVPEGTVKSRLHKAREQLYALLSGTGKDDSHDE